MDLVKLYSNHLAVHLNASKENLLEEYKKRYEIEEIPTARVTHHQATATPAVSLPAPPAANENYGQRARRILNERAAAIALRDNTPMDVAAEPVQQEQPPRPDTNIAAPLYFKLKTTLEVIFVSGWGEFTPNTSSMSSTTECRRLQPHRLFLFLLHPLPMKITDSGRGAFLTKERPPQRYSATLPSTSPRNLFNKSNPQDQTLI